MWLLIAHYRLLTMIPSTLLLATIVTEVAVGLVPALNIPTSLYARCKNYSKWHRCLEDERYGCRAKKVADGTFNNDSYKCTNQCPPPPDNIHLSIFKQPLFLSKPEDYTGINISWTINTKDYSYHYVDGFRVELRTIDHYLIKYVTVDVDQQPMDADGKIWFYYDCFYPVIKNRVWNLTIRTIPYNDELLSDEGKAKFALDENGDFMLMSITDMLDLLLPTSADILITRHTSFDPAASLSTISPVLSAEDNRMTELHQGYNTVKMLGIAIGLMTGLVFLVIVALVTVMVRQRSKTGSDASENVKSFPEVLLLYTKDNTNHVQQSRHLASALRDICTVTDIWHLESVGGHDVMESLYEVLRCADVIIVVYSHYIREKLQQLKAGCPISRSVEDLALYIMMNTKRMVTFRVITVYFPETTTCNIIEGVNWPQPMALPASRHALRHQIQNPQSWDVSSESNRKNGRSLELLANSVDSVSLVCRPGSEQTVAHTPDDLYLGSNRFTPIFHPAPLVRRPQILAVPSLAVGSITGPALPYAVSTCPHSSHRVQSAFEQDLLNVNAGLDTVSAPCPSYGSNTVNNNGDHSDYFFPVSFKPPRRWNSIETDIQSECIASINDEHSCVHHGNEPYQLAPPISVESPGVGRIHREATPTPTSSMLL